MHVRRTNGYDPPAGRFNMPAIAECSPQRCPDCSREMLWMQDAIVCEADRRDHAGYRCVNGHVSAACSVCGSRNTTRYGSGPLTGRRILSCGACGHLAAFINPE